MQNQNGILGQNTYGKWFVLDTKNHDITPVHALDYPQCKPGLHIEYHTETIAEGTSEFDVMDTDVARVILRKKAPRYQYGILITKPWSMEMYDHNDRVSPVVKANLKAALDRALLAFNGSVEDICMPSDDLYIIAKNICASGWSYYSAKDVYDDAIRELKRVQNYWLNTEYPALVKCGLCPQVDPFYIGY
jgi:hypothetical protein